jgi:hypothetical protein
LPEQPLHDEAAEGVTDRDRFGFEPGDDAGVVRDDVVDSLAGDPFRMASRLLDRVAVTGPARRDRRVAVLAEEVDPVAPRVGMQPEAVDENDGSVCRGALLSTRRFR